MKVEQKRHTTTIKDTQGNINNFLEKVTHEYNSFKKQNLILDVSHDKNVTITDIIAFSDLSKTHKKEKKSFVIVAENIDFNEVPSKIIVVPSLLEAHDIIEMEEIERDLGF
jgi:MFS superfamily sulfate permease-like transporter